MSKTSLFLLAVILLVFSLSLFIILRGKPAPISPPTITTLAPQENSGGDVDVRVTPKLLVAGEKPQFGLEFNTHSVELSFDIEAVSFLIDDQGNIYGRPVWKGSPPGGHHRSGTLTFAEPLKEIKSLTLVLSDISGVSKREFTWRL